MFTVSLVPQKPRFTTTRKWNTPGWWRSGVRGQGSGVRGRLSPGGPEVGLRTSGFKPRTFWRGVERPFLGSVCELLRLKAETNEQGDKPA